MDEDIRKLVKQWTAPAPGAGFDAAMLEQFRQRRPAWRRILGARVQVPVSVLAASLVLAGIVLVLAWPSSQRPEREGGWEPVAQPSLRVIRAEGSER